MNITFAGEESWADRNADLVDFLKEATWSDFYQSLYRAILKYGSLTERQEASARKGFEKIKARQKAAEAEADVPERGLDLTPLSGYYADPDPESDTRLKFLVQHGNGKWAGWIFVKDAAVYGANKRYGTQRPGGLYRGQIVEVLERALADPATAQAAYGKLTGRCGACGRPLEDEQSVARGLGPICAERLGL